MTGTTPEPRWQALADDLAGQLAAQDALEHHAVSTEIARAELAALTLVDRLRGAVGTEVVVAARGAGAVRGRVVAVGRDWLLLDDGVRQTLLLLVAALSISGLGSRAAGGRSTTEVEDRWGVGHVLRRHLRDRAAVRLVLDTGDVVVGTLDMVGADHVEVAEHDGDVPRRRAGVAGRRLVPISALSTVSREHPRA